MNDFEPLQRIIRLKRHEGPGEDFVEDFVARFRERQRAELLRQSARGLLWERFVTSWENLVSPRWNVAAVTACVAVFSALGATFFSTGSANSTQPPFLASSEPIPAALSSQPQLAVQSELIREVEPASQELEIEGVLLLSRHFDGNETIPTSSGHDNVAGLSGAALPISAQLQPMGGTFIR
jgi:hypothetical protein